MDRTLGIAIDADGIACAPRPPVPALLALTAGGAVVGERARALAATGHGAVYRDFTARVGDPVRLLSGDGVGRTGAELTALAVDALLDEALGGRPAGHHLTIAHPAAWGRHELAALRAELRHPALSTVARPVAVAAHAVAGRAVPRGSSVLVVDIGTSATELSTLTDVEDGTARIAATGWTAAFGTSVADRAVLALALRRHRVDPADRDGAQALADGARAARAALEDRPVAVVDVPGPEQVRITRDDLDHLLVDPVRELLGEVRGLGGRFGAVLVTGDGARTPLLLRALGEAFGVPVTVLPDPATATARAAAHVAALRAGSVPGVLDRSPRPGPGRHHRPATRPAPARPVAAAPGPATARPGRSAAGRDDHPVPPVAAAPDRPRRRRGGVLVAAVAAAAVLLGGGAVVSEVASGPGGGGVVAAVHSGPSGR